MRCNRTESGFAHAIIIVAVIAIIVGALGFVVWQRYSSNSDVPKNANNENVKSERNSSANINNPNETETMELTEVATDQTLGTGISIRYPKNWSLEHTQYIGDRGSQDFSTISSPDGQIKVHLLVGASGECQYDRSTTEIVKLESDTMQSYSDVRFVSYVYKHGESYYYFAGVQKITDKIAEVKVGDKLYCDFDVGGIPEINGKKFSLDIVATKFENIKDRVVITPDSVENVMATENYKIAKQIVQSLYVKE